MEGSQSLKPPEHPSLWSRFSEYNGDGKMQEKEVRSPLGFLQVEGPSTIERNPLVVHHNVCTLYATEHHKGTEKQGRHGIKMSSYLHLRCFF